MMTGTASLLSRFSSGLSVALLALGMTFGSSQAVRADEAEVLAPSSQDVIVAPIVKAIDGLAQRLSRLEASIALFAASFNSQRVATRQLCVSDDSGAETCITKAQLDGLLKRMARAEISEPAVTVAIVAPGLESSGADATAPEPFVPEITVADAIVTEASSTPIHDPIDTVPMVEAVAASDTATNEPQYTGSTGSDTDGAALVWYPDVEVTIVIAEPPESQAASLE